MTLDGALEIVVNLTHHERFRWLVSDDNPDDNSREGYRAFVLDAAVNGLPAQVPYVPPEEALARLTMSSGESLALLAEMKECPYRTTETECGCGGLAKCDLGKGKFVTQANGETISVVNHQDCFACLQEQIKDQP